MSAADEITSAATLIINAAKGVSGQLSAMPPCPVGQSGEALWHQQDAALLARVQFLTGAASQTFALAGNVALQNQWAALQGLDAVTASIQEEISRMAHIAEVLTRTAAIVDFAVAIAACAATPSPATAGMVVTTFLKIG